MGRKLGRGGVGETSLYRICTASPLFGSDTGATCATGAPRIHGECRILWSRESGLNRRPVLYESSCNLRIHRTNRALSVPCVRNLYVRSRGPWLPVRRR